MGAGIEGGIDGGTFGGGGGDDVTPPSLAIVSPTPGVAPGQPGGPPANRSAYRAMTINATVTDAVKVGLVVIDMLEGARVTPVFRAGEFLPGFNGTAIMTGATLLTLAIRNANGWPLTGFRLAIRAADGNTSA